jgi:hypothetical protein
VIEICFIASLPNNLNVPNLFQQCGSWPVLATWRELPNSEAKKGNQKFLELEQITQLKT